MKKLLTILLLIPVVGFSQIKKVDKTNLAKKELIGKMGPMGETWVKIEKQENKYTITYRDNKFQHLDDYKYFSFRDIDNAFENLYEMIMEGFKNPPKEDILLELPDAYIWLNYTKALGIVNMRFAHSVDKNAEIIGFSTWLTKKKAMKLFGKKKSKKKKKK